MTDVPLVEMLWESADPAEALKARFGFSPRGAAAWVAATLDDHWGIAVRDCERLVISAGNAMAWLITDDERSVIAKWSAVPPLFGRLNETSLITAWLDGRGIPVAAPIPAMDGRLRVELHDDGHDAGDGAPTARDRQFSLTVLPVIGGELLDVEDPAQVVDAGRMLALVHDALAACPYPLDGVQPTQEGQLVHNDFRSANILRDREGITAVLDLEEIIHSPRVADLAKASVLLGTRYHAWGPTDEEVRREFVAAYCDVSPLTPAEHLELTDRISAVTTQMGWA